MLSMKVVFDIKHLRYRHNRMRLLSHLRELHLAGKHGQLAEIEQAVRDAGHDLSSDIEKIRMLKIASTTVETLDRAEKAADDLEQQMKISEALVDINPKAVNKDRLTAATQIAQHELFKIKERDQKFYNLEWRVRQLMVCATKVVKRLAINRNSKRTPEIRDASIDSGEAD